MNKENEKYFFDKYPKLFRQRNLPMTETCMCWGLECGDGWFKILDWLCSNLQWDIDHNNYPQVEFTQVKEKFGTFRLYYSYADKDEKSDYDQHNTGVQEGMIRFTEQLSAYVCELCGSFENIGQTSGWIITCCEKCAKEKQYEWTKYKESE